MNGLISRVDHSRVRIEKGLLVRRGNSRLHLLLRGHLRVHLSIDIDGISWSRAAERGELLVVGLCSEIGDGVRSDASSLIKCLRELIWLLKCLTHEGHRV